MSKKKRKMDRNKKAVAQAKQKNAKKKYEEMTAMRRTMFINKKMDYMKNTINGRYFLARANMLAEQIISNDIKESIDGAKKTFEYVQSEYALMKMQAINSLRNAYFAKQDLLKEFGMTEQEVIELEKDYYSGKIVRDSYDEDSWKKDKKPKFTKEE